MMSIDRQKAERTKFIQEPSLHLTCPVCKQLYRNPVINIKCGHTFCQPCAFDITCCPLDDSHCDTSQLVVNRLVVGQIEDLQIYCCHSLIEDETGEWKRQDGGCSEVLLFGKREEHERTCSYALIQCPNSDECINILRKNIDEHLQACDQFKCEHNKKGCRFRGSKSLVDGHSPSCVFSNIVPDSSQLAQRLVSQDAVIMQLKSDNGLLSSQVAEITKAHRDLGSTVETQASLIHTLQQQVDALSSRLDQLSGSSHFRRPASSVLSSSQMSLVEGGSTHSSPPGTRSISSARHHSPSLSLEKWEMPFQFKCIGTLRGHKDVVWSMTTRKGLLYSGGADGIIKIWSLEHLAKGCTGNIQAHKGTVHCVSSWGNTLLSAGADRSINMWSLDSTELKDSIPDAHDNIICAMIVHEDLVITSSQAVIKIWELRTKILKATLTCKNHWVRALALAKTKDKLYSGSHNAIIVWDMKEGYDQLDTIEHDSGSVYSLAVTRVYIIAGTSGNYKNNILVFHAETHELVTNLVGHTTGPVFKLVASPSGRFLFSASQDTNIQMWSLEKLLPIQTLARHQGSVNTLMLHGDFLLSGSEDHEVKLYRYFQISSPSERAI